MFPTSKIYAAYDTLNLSRDASFQEVRDRWHQLQVRFSSSDNTERLKQAQEAFNILQMTEEQRSAQREATESQNQSKSERDLDTKLVKLSNDVNAKRVSEAEDVQPDIIKKQKSEEVKSEPLETLTTTTAPAKNDIVFAKLQSLLRDSSKYLRAVNVLCSLIQAAANDSDDSTITEAFMQYLFNTIEIALSARDPKTNIPIANSDEHNRGAAIKLLSTLEEQDVISRFLKEKGRYWDMWMHAGRFRNSLFDRDNFMFVKNCKQIEELIKSAVGIDDSTERLLLELELTLSVLVTKEVVKVVPGRMSDAKSTMTEVFKMTRSSKYPQQFKDKVAQLQIEIQSL